MFFPLTQSSVVGPSKQHVHSLTLSFTPLSILSMMRLLHGYQTSSPAMAAQVQTRIVTDLGQRRLIRPARHCHFRHHFRHPRPHHLHYHHCPRHRRLRHRCRCSAINRPEPEISIGLGIRRTYRAKKTLDTKVYKVY